MAVEALFYNTPARQKFMKGARSEWRAIQATLTSVALSRRDVRLRVGHDGREVMALPPSVTLRDRVEALWGAAAAESFVAVDDVSGPIRTSGLVERPADVGLASRRVFLFVNGRPVRDAGITRAAEAAYRSTLPSGVRPSLLLELTMPAGDVDVNVHPAKAEVRFRDRWTVERAVERAVRHALGTGDVALFTFSPHQPAAGDAGPVDVELLRSAPPTPPLFGQHDTQPGELAAHAVARDEAEARADPPPAPASAHGVAAQQRETAGDLFVPVLTQVRRTWLVFESHDGLVLIDQHSAHERILYERFMRGMADGGGASQALLFPLTLHLSPDELDAFDANRDDFARLGFDLEPFGGMALAVRAVPAPHARFDAERCLRETLAALAGDRAPSSLARHDRLAATVACKGAIKAGDALGSEEMRALYVGLARTTLPAHDVHGRSTIVKLAWDELERRFGRR